MNERKKERTTKHKNAVTRKQPKQTVVKKTKCQVDRLADGLNNY